MHADTHLPSQRARLNESPSQKEGKWFSSATPIFGGFSLNESPSEKEGKSAVGVGAEYTIDQASMKAIPNRKGDNASAISARRISTPQ